MAPPANILVMSGTLIQSFRHLEHHNLSIISEDIGRASGTQTNRGVVVVGGGQPLVLYRIEGIKSSFLHYHLNIILPISF